MVMLNIVKSNLCGGGAGRTKKGTVRVPGAVRASKAVRAWL